MVNLIMDWENIKGAGKIIQNFSNINLQAGKIKTREFLNEIMREFAIVSTRIYDNTGDIAFLYKEKQLSSIFLPSFYNLKHYAIQEVPTKRTKSKNKFSHGWLDYWVQKGDRWIYLMEVKHGWQFINGSFRKDSEYLIDSSINQLKQIEKEALNELSYLDTTYKLSFIIMPGWYNIPNSEDIGEFDQYIIDQTDISKTSATIVERLKNKVSWVGTWQIPSKMQISLNSDHVKNLRVFPCVFFIATIVD